MFGNFIQRIYNFKLTIQNNYTKKKLNHLKKTILDLATRILCLGK